MAVAFDDSPDTADGSPRGEGGGRGRWVIGALIVAPFVAVITLAGFATWQVRSAQSELGDELASLPAIADLQVTRSGPCPTVDLVVAASTGAAVTPEAVALDIVADLEASGFVRLDRHTHMRERGDDLDADLVEVRAGDAAVTLSASVFDHDLANCS